MAFIFQNIFKFTPGARKSRNMNNPMDTLSMYQMYAKLVNILKFRDSVNPLSRSFYENQLSKIKLFYKC